MIPPEVAFDLHKARHRELTAGAASHRLARSVTTTGRTDRGARGSGAGRWALALLRRTCSELPGPVANPTNAKQPAG